jgi:hypothetical protein
MAVKKLTSQEFDNHLLEFLRLKEEQKKINKRLEVLQSALESQYSLTPDQKEIVRGICTEMEKIPVNNGRNNFDPEKLRPFLKAIRKVKTVLKVVKVVKVDVKALNGLVDCGLLAPENLDVCRSDSWTFRSQFRRVEAVVQAVEKNEAVGQ